MFTITSVLLLCFIVLRVSCQNDYPCFTNWTYSMTSGKCYLFFTDTLDYAAALQRCKASMPSAPESAVNVGLSRMEGTTDVIGTINELINQANNALVWMDVTFIGNVASWSNGDVVNITLLASLMISANLSGPCLKFSYSYNMNNAGSSLGTSIISDQCSNSPASYFCQHKAASCSTDNLPLFSGDIEVLIPPSTTIGSTPYISCRTGYYRPLELLSPSVAIKGGIAVNYANCTGIQSSDLNPFKYQPSWTLNSTKTTIDVCLQVSCPFFNATLINVQNQIIIPPSQIQASYSFGYSFPLTCLKGFVNFADKTTILSAMTCQQSIFMKQLGVWSPPSNMPCTPVMCNLTQLLKMVPGNSVLFSAVNRASQRQYNVNLQQSSLPYYDNLLTIRCNDGFFFSDRTFQKIIICGLQNNSLTIGQWQGYLGTIIPLDANCDVSTCTYESIVITQKMNIQSTFYIMDSNGVYQNATQPSLNPYPFQTNMRFLCNDGYASVNQFSDQNLTCGPQGSWIPNLTPCVKSTAKLDLGNKLHYLPDAVESPSAKNVGYVVILILVIFISLIIVLDASTINRDARTMRNNIKNLKRFINRKKH